MQPVDDSVVRLVTADDITVEAGATLLEGERELDVDVAGSSVSRTGCQLVLADQLAWGRARVRPWMRLTSGSLTRTVHLGVYLLETPEETAYGALTVSGWPTTRLLDDEHGDPIVVDVDTSYVEAARDLVATRGLTLRVGSSGESPLTPRPRSWPLDTPTRTAVDELLDAAGWSPVRMDPDGGLSTAPWSPVTDRAPEWTYDTADPSTVVDDASLAVTSDLDQVPNRIVALTDAQLAWDPVEGDGRRTLENRTGGPASYEARGGRWVTRTVRLDAANQATLDVAAQAEAEQLGQVTTTVRVQVATNPWHWRDDVVRLVAPEVGIDGRALVDDWELPLDGSPMRLTLVSSVGSSWRPTDG